MKSVGHVVLVMLITNFCMCAGDTGTVKWLNADKGFGFITPDNGGLDVFTHFSETLSDIQNLDVGSRVTYDVTQAVNGLKAINVKLL